MRLWDAITGQQLALVAFPSAVVAIAVSVDPNTADNQSFLLAVGEQSGLVTVFRVDATQLTPLAKAGSA